jgi:hypothetical protein
MEVGVTVRNTTKEAFTKAFETIALDNQTCPKDKGARNEKRFRCIGYKIEDGKLYLSKYSEKCTRLPYDLDLQQTIDFAWGWLENNKTPLEKEPDTDGSTKEAFLVTTDVGYSDWGIMASVEPIWFVYGK